MDTIKWSDLPEELRSRKEIRREELPEGMSWREIPKDVTVLPLTGDALEASRRDMRELTVKIGTRAKAMGMTEEKLRKLLEEDKEERLAELAKAKQGQDE